jgi:L-cysteine desulfidase
MKQQEKILTEGESLALKQQVEIVNEANHKADKIILEAKHTVKVLEQELEKNFVESVKNTSKSVVKKLLQKDIELQNNYLEEIVHQSIK